MSKYLIFLPLAWILLMLFIKIPCAISLRTECANSERIGKEPKYQPLLLAWGLAALVQQCIFWMLATSFLGSVGHSKAVSAKTNAKCIYDAVMTYHEQHPTARPETIFACTSDPAQDGTPQQTVQELIAWGSGSYYYAVTFRENGAPSGAWWSKHPLSPDELRTYSTDELIRLYKSPFHEETELVGNFP